MRCNEFFVNLVFIHTYTYKYMVYTYGLGIEKYLLEVGLTYSRVPTCGSPISSLGFRIAIFGSHIASFGFRISSLGFIFFLIDNFGPQILIPGFLTMDSGFLILLRQENLKNAI